jgi:hypothetical protein
VRWTTTPITCQPIPAPRWSITPTCVHVKQQPIHVKPAAAPAPTLSSAEDPDSFRIEMLLGARRLMQKCIQASSDVKYTADWHKWCVFTALFERHDPNSEDSRFMLKKSTTTQLETFGAFMHYAADKLKLRASTIVGVMSGVRHFFRCNYLPLDIFTHPSVRSIKHSLALEERASSDYTAPQKKLPLTLDMVVEIRNRSLLTHNLAEEMVGVAVVMAFMCLLRVSEYVPKYQTKSPTNGSPAFELDEDGFRCHAILAKDVLFEVESEVEGAPSTFIVSFRMRADMWHRVLLIKITLRSAKNDVMRAGNTFWYTNLVGQTVNLNIVKVCFDWAIAAQHKPKDFFMSFNLRASGSSVSNIILTYAAVSKTIKHCASLNQLDPRRFGTHSARIGGATAVRAAGGSDSMVKRLGRWLTEHCAIDYPATSQREFDLMQLLVQQSGNYTTRDLRIQHTPIGDHW